MEEVHVEPVSLDRLAAILSPDRAGRLRASAVRARASFGDRVVWHVNSTARGGGVAEMLQTLLAYGKGAGIDNRWLVLDADPGFFRTTKRLHNLLHGSPGDGGPLGQAEHEEYRAVLSANLEQLERRVAPGDIVLIHDPQTAGLAEGLRRLGARVVWRCHVGCDVPNDAQPGSVGSSCARTSSTPSVWCSRVGSTPPTGPMPSRLVVIAPVH